MSQNDLSIANQGFASFRSDLNSALQALGSTNSGTSAPSTTYANQLFYDTTNNILKIRNEDNDAFISLFTLDQSNDNIESLTINGVLTADSLVANGGVTIDNITIDGTEIDLSSGDLTIDVAGDIILDADGGDVAFRDGGTGHLQISNVSNDVKILSLQTDKDIIFSGIDGGSEIEAMRIDMSAGGNVGIGTSSPTDTGGFGRALDISSSTGGAVYLRDADGSKVGHIGQFNEQLSITSRQDDGVISLFTGASPSERMRIDNSGNLFVGKTSSGSANVGFEYNNAGQLAVTRSGDTVALLNRTSSDGRILDFRRDNSLIGAINVEGGDLVIGSDDTALQFVESIESIRPFTVSTNQGRDNAIDLGTASQRFDDIFATNSSIQTSDQNEKQDIASVTTKELNVAKKLSALFKTFRWKDKVTEKGDKARTHTGIIAQELQSVFSAEGLDVTKYALFTSTTWWEKEISVDAVEADEEKGIEAKDAYTKLETFHFESDAPSDAIKKTRLGVRYPELFSFIFSSIEARLTALESK